MEIALGTEPYDNWNDIWAEVQPMVKKNDVKWTVASKKLFRQCFTFVDPEAQPVIAKKLKSLDKISPALFPGQKLPADIKPEAVNAICGIYKVKNGKKIKGVAYIRIGTYKKKLQDHPEKERELWRVFERTPFDKGLAMDGATSDDVLSLIDYPNYFRLMKQPLPENRKAILERLTSEKVLVPKSRNRHAITNVGAVLFARNLNDFDRLARKALRVIIYRGDNRVETIKEQMGGKGYAIGFEGAIAYINDQLPQNEQIGQALRLEIRMVPEIAVRELVANALIHQDFNVTGAGPMVEIFTDRMEISNPGLPLIDTLRFIDEPPRSRNESLAGLMRRMNICEERGSGIDKVIFHVELFQLPAPDFRSAGSSTVAVLYGPRKFAQMDREERIRACYQHACLLYVSGKRMANSTLRKRLGIKESSYTLASRIISDTIDVGLIRLHSGTRRDACYVPFWA